MAPFFGSSLIFCHIFIFTYPSLKSPTDLLMASHLITFSLASILLFKSNHLPLERAMAPHSSTLAWKIPWTEELGRLQSIRLLRVGHNWVTSLSLFTFTHWRRKLQPTQLFLPWEPQGRGSLVGCRLWGHTVVWLKWLSSNHLPQPPTSQFSSVAQSCPTLQPNGLQHARPPCPSPTPRACSNSCPLSWWCHPTISASVVPFSSCF